MLDKKEHSKKPVFHDLVKFVRREARKATDPAFGKDAMKNLHQLERHDNVNRQHPKSTFATKVTEIEKHPDAKPIVTTPQSTTDINKPGAYAIPCNYCKGSHALETCWSFSALPFLDRTAYLKTKGFCFGCLRFGHHRRLCQNKATCRHCSGRHPSVLHVNGPIPTSNNGVSSENNTPTTNVASVYANLPVSFNSAQSISDGVTECSMAIIPVKVRVQGNNTAITTYAFLDPGSNASFCAEHLMHQLGVVGKQMKLTMNTMGSKHTMHTSQLEGIELLDLTEQNVIQLPAIYTKDEMPVSSNHIPTSEDLHKWPHLTNMELPQVNADVGLLIGNNVPDASAPLEVKTGPRGSPYMSRSLLGWIPWGVLRNSPNILVNRADVLAIEQFNENQDLNDLYIKSVNLDFPEKTICDKREYSQEDYIFLDRIHGSQRIVDNHYEYQLPFRDTSPSLPNNQYVAKQRLVTLKKRLSQNPCVYEDYRNFMNALLVNDHAEEVAECDLARNDGKIWYLPHHSVYSLNKPNKIRVVFDGSSKYCGVSLNDKLLQGPDQTNSLVGVLLRYRQDHIAVTGDIEKMFYQVRVAKQDRDCLRYLWWPDGDLSSEPAIYRMKVHLFGAVSSPSVSTFALRQTVSDHKHEFDTSISQLALTNFYVDDFLCATSSEGEAINIVKSLSSLCDKGGFRITKWMSNNRNVVESIPKCDRAASVVDLNFEIIPTERALGVLWDVQKDVLGFSVHPKSIRPTRRNILSIISSVFDPLGIAAPFILPGKILLQDLCHKGVGWDTELSDIDSRLWSQLADDLPDLAGLKVARCIKPPVDEFGEIVDVQIHHFSDASDKAYGTASYIRFVSASGNIHCTFIFGKSRVAPLKKITIPRMELTAATLAVKLNNMIITELSLHVDNVYYWTDSTTVIRYVQNQSTRFHTFVANRLSVIHEGSEVDQWKFVDGTCNPADISSRGLHIGDTKKTDIWINGPQFLREPDMNWPKYPQFSVVIPHDDPETKRTVLATTIEHTHMLDEMLTHFSDWMKLKRTMGWVLYFIERLKSRISVARSPLKSVKPLSSTNAILPIDVLRAAEKLLIKHVQHQYFSDELTRLADVKTQRTYPCVKSSSCLYKLDPFLKDDLIRVGGRLTQASLPYNMKHQIILPRMSPLSTLILQDIHKSTGHLGKNAILSTLRQTYWIPRAGQMIKGIISKCVDCRKYYARPGMQKMADLPPDRVMSDNPPFSYVGMDYFGPFNIKRGRTLHKRYGVIFTCCNSRAVHLEIAQSLTTDSCINAIRRFLARRGRVISIRSDNGTNLVGAKAEMRREIKSWNQSKIGRSLQQHNVEWIFNSPAASHFGGFWERLIRSVRRILYSLLREQTTTLDDESLQTLLCETEQILNNRPLTPVSEDPHDLDVLTPNHLLLLGENISMTPGSFTSTDNYVKRRWRQVQHLANVFWSRWTKEYIPLLQQRQKWIQPHRNLAIGDLVLLMGNTPRNVWTMGRVTEVLADSKNLVRVVTVRTKANTLQRPVDKLCLILEADN